MNKKTLIIAGIALVIIAGAIFSLTRGSEIQSYPKESLTIEQDLMPIELSQEERQALLDEGIELLSVEEDEQAKALQSVRISDELDAIEADLNETDLSGLDAELKAIKNNLFGL